MSILGLLLTVYGLYTHTPWLTTCGAIVTGAAVVRQVRRAARVIEDSNR